eukprot:g2764.t1
MKAKKEVHRRKEESEAATRLQQLLRGIIESRKGRRFMEVIRQKRRQMRGPLIQAAGAAAAAAWCAESVAEAAISAAQGAWFHRLTFLDRAAADNVFGRKETCEDADADGGSGSTEGGETETSTSSDYSDSDEADSDEADSDEEDDDDEEEEEAGVDEPQPPQEQERLLQENEPNAGAEATEDAQLQWLPRQPLNDGSPRRRWRCYDQASPAVSEKKGSPNMWTPKRVAEEKLRLKLLSSSSPAARPVAAAAVTAAAEAEAAAAAAAVAGTPSAAVATAKATAGAADKGAVGEMKSVPAPEQDWWRADAPASPTPWRDDPTEDEDGLSTQLGSGDGGGGGEVTVGDTDGNGGQSRPLQQPIRVKGNETASAKGEDADASKSKRSFRPMPPSSERHKAPSPAATLLASRSPALPLPSFIRSPDKWEGQASLEHQRVVEREKVLEAEQHKYLLLRQRNYEQSVEQGRQRQEQEELARKQRMEEHRRGSMPLWQELQTQQLPLPPLPPVPSHQPPPLLPLPALEGATRLRDHMHMHSGHIIVNTTIVELPQPNLSLPAAHPRPLPTLNAIRPVKFPTSDLFSALEKAAVQHEHEHEHEHEYEHNREFEHERHVEEQQEEEEQVGERDYGYLSSSSSASAEMEGDSVQSFVARTAVPMPQPPIPPRRNDNHTHENENEHKHGHRHVQENLQESKQESKHEHEPDEHEHGHGRESEREHGLRG